MAATTSSTPSIIEVSTTMPILDNLPTFTPSDRLIFRPLSPSDLEALHSIRRQPEPMLALGATKPDNDLNETRKYFEQSEKSNFVRFGIFLKNLDGNEGELIGEGGVQIRNTNWPSPSWSSPYYILKKEHWNKGYATEFLKAFLQFWFNLPRKKTLVKAPFFTVDSREKGGDEVTEILMATTTFENERSIKVLRKAGFRNCAKSQVKKLLIWRYPPEREIS